MNTPNPAAEEPREENVAPAPEPTSVEAAAEAAAAEPAAREPIVHRVEREVTLQRSVRYGRVIGLFLVAGSMLAMLLSLLAPVLPDADYTLGQAVGFMALIGAVIGLAVGCIVSLILGAVAKRGRGRGVAIQSDVQ